MSEGPSLICKQWNIFIINFSIFFYAVCIVVATAGVICLTDSVYASSA